MKTTILFRLILIYSVNSSASSSICKTDIYYANGILTKDYQAKYNAEQIIEPAIKKMYTPLEYSERIGKVGYAYNETYGAILLVPKFYLGMSNSQ